MKLSIGGEVEGYVCVDRKLGSEAYPLNYPDDHFQEVRASHVLEHLPREQVELAVKEWMRVLKPGGSLKIAVPNFDYIVSHREDPKWQGWLFGGQTDKDDFHRVAFTESILRGVMSEAGLDGISRWHDDVDDTHRLPVSLNLSGVKPSPKSQAPWPRGDDKSLADCRSGPYVPEKDQIKIVAVMSCPRLGWTDTFGSIQEAFMPLGIKVLRHSGVFWGQGLTKLMEAAVEQDVDFIITVDYDSVFTINHVHRLCQLIVENDGVDVIVSVQVKRENNHALFTIIGEDGKPKSQVAKNYFDKPLSKIATGHFGLTIIRTSSLAKLSKPWFLATPDKDGRWETDYTDEDIHFWRNCEKAGLEVRLANEVSIGHLQNVISWPTKTFEAQHQFVGKYHEEGQPLECGGGLKVVTED